MIEVYTSQLNGCDPTGSKSANGYDFRLSPKDPFDGEMKNRLNVTTTSFQLINNPSNPSDGSSPDIKAEDSSKVDFHGSGLQLSYNGNIISGSSAGSAGSAYSKNQFHKKMECLMCDDVRVVGSTPLDLHKHLVEKHFRDRLLDLIPSIGGSLGGKPRYCCPFQGCFYEHHYKWIIAKHYGIKHRVAKQFYDEVTGATGRGHFDAAKTVTKVTPQDQSNFQSVIALKEQLQAQQQQLQRQLQQPWQLSLKGKAYKQPPKYFGGSRLQLNSNNNNNGSNSSVGHISDGNRSGAGIKIKPRKFNSDHD